MKKLIKIARSKSIRSILYDDSGWSGVGTWVYIHYKDNTYEKMLKFSNRSWDHADYSQTSFPLILYEDIIEFQSCNKYHCLLALCPWKPVIEFIHKYLLDLFGSALEYRWKTSTYFGESRSIFSSRSEVFVPQLQNLSACCVSCGSKLADMEMVQHYFSSSPVFKRIDFSTGCRVLRGPPPTPFQLFLFREYTTEETFPPESNFYQAESIGISQYEVATPAVLHHFRGRQAFITIFRCDSLDLIQFVNRWKSGEAFQNLEHLKVELRELRISQFYQNQVLNGIGAKHIDATKQPPTHTLPKIYIDNGDAETNTNPITSHAYVVRESDGRVASVLVQAKTFTFGVWDMTEEEFLRMME